jgi:hypothetical protein
METKKTEKLEINILSKKKLHEIKVGDVVERMLAFRLPNYWQVTEVTDDFITIGLGWTFDRNTGLEVDEDISVTVSYLRRILTKDQIELLKTGLKEIPWQKEQ